MFGVYKIEVNIILKYMKKLALTFSLLVFSVAGYSQQMDQRLLEVYSEQELTEIKTKDIGFFNALVYGLENGTYITDMPQGKELENIKSIKLPKGNYTYASLGLRISEESNQYIKIEGTNKLLVVKSAIVLKNELKYKK